MTHINESRANQQSQIIDQLVMLFSSPEGTLMDRPFSHYQTVPVTELLETDLNVFENGTSVTHDFSSSFASLLRQLLVTYDWDLGS